MNTNKSNGTQNKYGHLLDKYMDDAHVNFSIKQGREKESKDKYGGLLDKAKLDDTILNDILNVSNACRNIQRKRADKYEQANLRRQERIERERREEQERRDKHEAYINNFLDKKEAERKAVEKKKQEEAEKADFYKRVERLANIDPHMAEVFIQTVGCK